jgi:predicted phosphodiesterase
MKIALFSDIHGNITGLQAVLARLDQLGGADHTFALGDYLAVGPGADDLMDLLLARNIRMVRGNWDEIFIDPDAYIGRLPPEAQPFVIENHEWLQRNVSTAAQALIAQLPLHDEVEVAAGRRLFLCHAAPGDPWNTACNVTTSTATLRAVYGAVDADVVAYGHYHAHHVLHLDGKLLLNVASVGMKRGGQSALTLLEYTDERWNVQQYQVPYDLAAFERLSVERGVPRRPA